MQVVLGRVFFNCKWISGQLKLCMIWWFLASLRKSAYIITFKETHYAHIVFLIHSICDHNDLSSFVCMRHKKCPYSSQRLIGTR